MCVSQQTGLCQLSNCWALLQLLSRAEVEGGPNTHTHKHMYAHTHTLTHTQTIVES